ncbi:hypothetical protein LTR04_005412 [Oleoguttula sp. CCFEE 6159]|nr:hypothetical protein LTR04_005412 [Oleoguttula sp. CCFEE 6159]
MQKKRVAIVGSGVSGLGALWALKNTPHEVHLYEAADRLGGHTNTAKFELNRKSTNVDTGFIVLNSATYPNFLAFLKEVGVKPVPTEMTFGVSRDQGLFEWAGTSLSAVFAQRSNMLRPSMWRMIFDIIRFNQFALDLLSEKEENEDDPSGANGTTAKRSKPRPIQRSIGEYLRQEGYSDSFRDDYLIPMTAAVWSTAPDKCSLDFPALTLVRFMWNHHLLSTIAARPTWMTLKGGSKQYIDAIMRDFPAERIHLSTPARHVVNISGDRVMLGLPNGQHEIFDHVVLACHGDQALRLISGTATEEEQEIMSAFQTSPNTAYLHSDLSLMPRREIAWSAWNYLTESSTSSPSSSVDRVSLTYWMNLLQHIPEETFGSVLVTLNPLHAPKEELTQGKWEYHHPLYNTAAIHAQGQLPRIQNTRGISYCGAWTKYGFHEDGFSSGLKVAMEHLEAKLPFDFVDSTFSRGRRPTLHWQDYLVRLFVACFQFWISLLDDLVNFVKSERGGELRKKVL